MTFGGDRPRSTPWAVISRLVDAFVLCGTSRSAHPRICGTVIQQLYSGAYMLSVRDRHAHGDITKYGLSCLARLNLGATSKELESWRIKGGHAILVIRLMCSRHTAVIGEFRFPIFRRE
ncbi:hypothetical protein AG1IA_00627 [Rhizoctonia solani AG-1 IA]|uniref:Uncharacterized protein n=1 Tax=Thanatephorus cucumeris (strain AG1-IA) TaxID=983506 RepID=L8X9J3_THACA|nr:hypothetical protein AG1IA_00627 [Rhizoctonia solani AG-1 IA]